MSPTWPSSHNTFLILCLVKNIRLVKWRLSDRQWEHPCWVHTICPAYLLPSPANAFLSRQTSLTVLRHTHLSFNALPPTPHPPSDNLSPLLSKLILNPVLPLRPALTTLAYQELSHLWRPTAALCGTTLMRCLRSGTIALSPCVQGKPCSPSSSPRPRPSHSVAIWGTHN